MKKITEKQTLSATRSNAGQQKLLKAHSYSDHLPAPVPTVVDYSKANQFIPKDVYKKTKKN